MALRSSPPIALRRVRLTLETPSEAPDALGGAIITYSALTTLWARIEALGGRETIVGARLEGQVDTRISLRWRAGVNTKMRFSASGRLFAIQAVFDPDGRRRALVCLCREITT